MTRRFDTFGVIDWSGAAVRYPGGLAVAVAHRGDAAPTLVPPPGGRWSREAILAWLGARKDDALLIGLDLSPALPFVDEDSYFPGWPDAPGDARALWAFVDAASDASPHLSAGGVLAHPIVREHFLHQRYRGAAYAPANGRLRECEIGQAGMTLTPASCFKLIGANQVGKSSLTGMRVLNRLVGTMPVWPFDPVPERGALIVEIYTAIAAVAARRTRNTAKIRRWEELDDALRALGSRPTGCSGTVTDHKSDALLTAAWLRANADHPELWSPARLTPEIARTEGWTFGVA